MVSNILLVFPEEKYYNNNGGRGTYDGARCWKWHYQTDGSLKEYTVSMDNDFAIFRYADVVLMYVEALVRQTEQVRPSNWQTSRRFVQEQVLMHIPQTN